MNTGIKARMCQDRRRELILRLMKWLLCLDWERNLKHVVSLS